MYTSSLSVILLFQFRIRTSSISETEVKFSDGAACCVVMASEGYPSKYQTGFPISLPETEADEEIYIAGAKAEGGKLLTSGGRVLGAVAKAEDLKTAVEKAYRLSDKIHFENAYRRGDIGARALQALGENG